MNRNARDIIYVFTSDKNKTYLGNVLKKYFNDNRVDKFVGEMICILVNNFADGIKQELVMSDTMPGITLQDQVDCYNCQFITDRISYIRAHVAGEEIPQYVVTDGMPTSRFGSKHHAMSADKQLQTWAMNSGRGVQGREDTHGEWDITRSERTRCAAPPNGYWGDSSVQTGITFCDQSELGTANHLTQLLGTKYVLALNQDAQPHTNDAFGNATAASDARLLSRRTFNNNEEGIENGIPRYRSRLHGRNLDRDVREGMQGRERDCMVHGHDMTSLHARVDEKNRVRDIRGAPNHKLKLQNNSVYVDTHYK